MTSNSGITRIKKRLFIVLLINQSIVCLLLSLLGCKNEPTAQWDCDEPLPRKFKIVYNGQEYAIKADWGYLGLNENGWVIELPVRYAKQFDDSCGAKNFFALYQLQHAAVEKKFEEQEEKDSLEKLRHQY